MIDQEKIYEQYCTLLDGTKYEVGIHALDNMKLNPAVDPKTIERCEKYLRQYIVLVDSIEDEDTEAYARERETQRAESRNAPSEGFDPV